MLAKKERLWTKEFVLTSIVNFFLMLAMFLLIIIMAGYAMKEYNASTSLAGFTSSIFIFGALLGRLFAGKRMNSIGAKPMLMIGSTIFLIMSIFYFIPISIYGLLALRIIQGVGLGFATTATGTIVAQTIPQSRTGEGIGYFSSSVVLAQAIGPLIGILLVSGTSYFAVFTFSLIMGIVSLILGFFIKAPKIEETEEEKSEKKSFNLSAYFEKTTIPIATVMLFVGVAYSSILSFISTYAEEIDLVTAGTLYFVVYSIVVLLTRPISGRLLDEYGGNAVVYPTIIIFAVGMLLLSQASTSFTFLLAAAIIGIGYGNFQSSTQAIAIQRAPMEKMGLANATYYIFYDFSLGLGPLFLGSLISLAGYRGMYLSLVFVILFAFPLYHFLIGNKKV